MVDYEPVDLSEWYNVGSEVLPEDEDLSPGLYSFQGLPFLVGGKSHNRKSQSFIGLGGADRRTLVAVDDRAHNVIFAHRLLESKIHENGPLGITIAEYVFHLSEGIEYRVPIRERFEIAAIPNRRWLTGVPGAPFRALPDQKNGLMPRYEGPWELAGIRPMESVMGSARSLYLWAWSNPEPERTIESIEIIANGPRFIVAGVTLGHLDEHLFPREGRRPVRVTLKDASRAQRPFDLSVEVDRGDSTYSFALPEITNEEFMNDMYKGYGQEANTKSSPAYVEISAIPSATVTVKQGDKEVGKVNWGEVEQNGAAETANVRLELLDRGKNWVHVTVLDDDTGKPVPCRIHFRSPEGVPYQPHGHPNHVNSNLASYAIDVGGDVRLGQITYAYIDGTCQGWLPRGEVIVDVARGYEYEPLRTKVRIEPGQRELTLGLKRWINMNSLRWFSGDTHVHFLSTQGAHMEARAEGLNLVNVLQSQWGSLFTNVEDFTGAPSISENENTIVFIGQENRQHVFGHMILVGMKHPVVPMCTDGPSESETGGTMEITAARWADQCHDQGGYVISAHFPSPNGEPAALIATHRVDAVEMIRHTKYAHNEYYRYLNCGYRLPLAGGTDKQSNDVPTGLYRTYVYIPEDEEFNFDNWHKNLSKGRSFLSGGPIIHFTVNGHQLGDTVMLSEPGTVEVEAWAESIFPIYRLEIVQAGQVVASVEAKKGARRLDLKEKVKIDGHTWLAARCGGQVYFQNTHFASRDDIPYIHFDGWGDYDPHPRRRGIFAHTSPIYVACNGKWSMFDKDAAKYILTMVEGALTYIREVSRQYNPEWVSHHHGEEDHLGYLERSFVEAKEAIQERAHRLGITL